MCHCVCVLMYTRVCIAVYACLCVCVHAGVRQNGLGNIRRDFEPEQKPVAFSYYLVCASACG